MPVTTVTRSSSNTVRSASFPCAQPSPSFNLGAPVTSSPQPNTWNPIYIKTKFTDGQMKVHQAIMILLPGGVGHTKTEDIELSLEDTMADTYLKISIQWPHWIVSHDFLKVLRETLAKKEAPKLNRMDLEEKEAQETLFAEYIVLLQLAFKQQMVLMRPQSDSPMLRSWAMIKLDMAVKPITYHDWHLFGDLEGVRMVFVDLKAQAEMAIEKSKTKSVEFGVDAMDE